MELSVGLPSSSAPVKVIVVAARTSPLGMPNMEIIKNRTEKQVPNNLVKLLTFTLVCGLACTPGRAFIFTPVS
jgi:hypothetical protein